MVDVETLQIIIEIVDSFSNEIRDLEEDLTELRGIAETLDTIRIDVDVQDHELSTLEARLAALEAQNFGMNIDAPRGRGGGGGGGAPLIAPDMMIGLPDVLDDLDLDMDGSDLSDSLSEMSEAAGNTSRGIDGFRLRMESLHNVLASIIPLILVLIGALPAVITGLVALGAAAISAAIALAALTGLGAFGAAMTRAGPDGNLREGFKEVLSEIITAFKDAFAPVAMELAPLFEKGLDSLDSFLDSLAQAAMHFITLEDEVEGLWNFLEEFLSGAIENIARMTEAFAPLFGMFGDFLVNFSILRELTQLMSEMLPEFTLFIGLLMDMLPVIARISIGFLDLTNVILYVINIFFQLVEALGIEKEVGLTVAAVLTLISVLSLLAAMIKSNLIAMMVKLTAQIGYVVAAKLAWASTAGTAAIATGILTGAVHALRVAVTALLAATGIGLLVTVVGQIAGSFIGMGESVNEATRSLQNFDRVRSRVAGSNPFESPTGTGGDAFTRSPRPVSIQVSGNSTEEASEAANRAAWREKTLGGGRGF